MVVGCTFSQVVSNGKSRSHFLKNLIHEVRVLGKDPPIRPLLALSMRKLAQHFTGPELHFPASEGTALKRWCF